ncbi:hypothetical protein [Halomonas caseinilytica]|uniref:Uncharacterized protein n=1 Tax=Halomonas caseinilytica TaxID=438744 RepID=A0A1M6NY98_9GAMM|nr:hypothetical protein [Halomonas caseinilytica]SEM24868.1 hypothetical protein SAMN04487952_102255 [Halomonas caseinilytica]SHK00673.1 hypothetical protein SAMN05192556_101559 [Halomonas caseinilytica]
MRLTKRPLLAPVTLATILLSGCTTYSWPDGSRETVWGVPAENETKTEQQRQQEAPRYRVPGEIPDER